MISFDPLLALTLRLPISFLRYLLLVLIAVTIVIALQVVGIALMLAMLVTPAAAAQLLTRRLLPMMGVAAVIGAVSAVAASMPRFTSILPRGRRWCLWRRCSLRRAAAFVQAGHDSPAGRHAKVRLMNQPPAYEMLCTALRDGGYQLTRRGGPSSPPLPPRTTISAPMTWWPWSTKGRPRGAHDGLPYAGSPLPAGGHPPHLSGGGAAQYALLQDGHHHHLVCTGCAAGAELEDCRLQALEAQLASRFGFEVQGHLVEFYGRCAACRDAAAQ